MNFAQDAKGFIKRDVTVEFPTVIEAEKAAGDALDAYARVATEKGLKLLEVAAS
jgi:hypothetical protein